tara:strand:- start:201 stop:752 length:552 start_codon:yes stop_codon:yes gene_type:complete
MTKYTGYALLALLLVAIGGGVGYWMLQESRQSDHGEGKQWQLLEQAAMALRGQQQSLQQQLQQPLQLRAPAKLKVGDALRFSVTASVAGKLWVWAVDGRDEVSRLAPITMSDAIKVEEHTPLLYPPTEADWQIEVGVPTGPSLLVVYVGQSLPEALAPWALPGEALTQTSTGQIAMHRFDVID